MRVRYEFQRRGSRLMAWLLARDQYAPDRRRRVFIGLGVFLWLTSVLLIEHPDVASWVEVLVQPYGADPRGLVGFLFTIAIRLFHPFIWRHLLVALLAAAVATAGGARYLDDIFELKNVEVALQYMWTSVFGGRYSWIEIKDGKVTRRTRNSPAYLIGGPGYAKIHLGSAALFERVGGRSIVVGATNAHFLHGFERLREVVDLKNQHRSLPDIEVFTKDGILVNATDIRAEFRVSSGGQPRSARSPYPFSPAAVRRLVYGKAVGREDAMNPVVNVWTRAVAGSIGGMVRKYIESNLLDDLIQSKDEPSQGEPEQTQENGVTGGGEAGQDGAKGQSGPSVNPRKPLSISFYDPDSSRRFESMGVEMLWVGAGTLKTPPEVSKAWIAEWQSKWQAEVKSSQAGLETERKRGRGRLLASFVTEIGRWARRQVRAGTGFNALGLLLTYHRILAPMYKATVEEKEQLSDGVAEALDYIKKLSGPRIIGESPG